MRIVPVTNVRWPATMARVTQPATCPRMNVEHHEQVAFGMIKPPERASVNGFAGVGHHTGLLTPKWRTRVLLYGSPPGTRHEPCTNPVLRLD